MKFTFKKVCISYKCEQVWIYNINNSSSTKLLKILHVKHFLTEYFNTKQRFKIYNKASDFKWS